MGKDKVIDSDVCSVHRGQVLSTMEGGTNAMKGQRREMIVGAVNER